MSHKPCMCTHKDPSSFLIGGHYTFVHSMQSRKLQEHGWKPRWFQKEGENGSFRYVGGYWEARERGNWDGCPNIFGEFNEELVESSEGPWHDGGVYYSKNCIFTLS